MNNSDFWASVNNIIAEGFTPEGLQKLDSYAEQFISGKLVYQRFSSHEQHGCAEGGATNVIASLLAGADVAANRGLQKSFDFKEECQRGKAQESINPHNWTFATPDIYLSDLHDENVIRSKDGNIFVIDCDIRINTPELKCGGTRVLSTDVKI